MRSLKLKKNKLEVGKRGAIALSSVLILAIILLIMGLAMAFSEFIENNIVYNQNRSMEAFYAAESGAKDAMQKISRNKDHTITNYCLSLGKNSAEVNVAKAGLQTEVISKGISGSGNCIAVGSNYKRVRAVLDVNAEGKVAIASWEELGN